MGMHARFDQLDLPTGDAPFVRLRIVEQEPPTVEPSAWQHGGGYAKRPMRTGTIASILLAHVGLLAALIQFDVIEIQKKKADPLVVTLVPEQITPPPATPDKPEPVEQVRPIEPRIVAPDPVVVVPQPAPIPVATVRELPPEPVTVAAPAAPAAPSPATPAPITPPDASAASLKNPAPRYPIESRRKREEGTVRLRVVITADGRVKTISVAKSSGFERLDEAALDTVRKWKFKPGEQSGVAVEAVGFLVIPFKIAN
jgi:protein TonB